MTHEQKAQIAARLRDIIKVSDCPPGMVECLPENALAFIAREAKDALALLDPLGANLAVHGRV